MPPSEGDGLPPVARDLTAGRPIVEDPSYPGTWYQVSPDQLVGIRRSPVHGLTIEFRPPLAGWTEDGDVVVTEKIRGAR